MSRAADRRGEKLKRGASLHRVRYAAVSAIVYLAISGGYIMLSSPIAARMSASIEDLARVEMIKGLLFVLSSAVVIFLLTYVLLGRIARRTEELMEHQNALMVAERRALAGVLASTVAHDFKNLLTILGSGIAELSSDAVCRSLSDPRLLEDMRQAVKQGTILAVQLNRAGHCETIDKRQELNLLDLTSEAIQLVRAHPKLHEAEVIVCGPKSLRAIVYPTLVHQILINLVINAGDAVRENGRVEVRVYQDDGNPTIEVHDDGPGISDETRSQIFDAFFTTKQSGTGLGLLSVRVCAEWHGGSVELLDSDLGGSCFRVRLGPLPKSSEPPDALEFPANERPLDARSL